MHKIYTSYHDHKPVIKLSWCRRPAVGVPPRLRLQRLAARRPNAPTTPPNTAQHPRMQPADRGSVMKPRMMSVMSHERDPVSEGEEINYYIQT
ncbi:hypothetical protein EYF80_030135 [Liparis tanakae]|uniref:Uncharacterized protein n=1 Tax=Liparis tanakae TaxID=230148 RepID=A0A4Z2H1K1_9TELE|nr:hypothetical protein EYF80_030135 [Liparis tanakae]